MLYYVQEVGELNRNLEMIEMNTTGKLLVSAINDLATAFRKIEQAENLSTYDEMMKIESIRLSMEELTSKLADLI